MGKYTRQNKFEKGLLRIKKWFKRLRNEKIKPNKGVEDQRGTVDGFINEIVASKQGGGRTS